MKIEINLPDNITLEDIAGARGAIIEASRGYVDWEKLYNKQDNSDNSISTPDRILLAIVHQLDKLFLFLW